MSYPTNSHYKLILLQYRSCVTWSTASIKLSSNIICRSIQMTSYSVSGVTSHRQRNVMTNVRGSMSNKSWWHRNHALFDKKTEVRDSQLACSHYGRLRGTITGSETAPQLSSRPVSRVSTPNQIPLLLPLGAFVCHLGLFLMSGAGCSCKPETLIQCLFNVGPAS